MIYQDEVVALGERLALRLEDLVPLIQHDIKWTYGCPTFCSTKTPTRNGSLSNSHEDLQEDTKLRKNEVFENSRNGIVVKDGDNKKRHLCLEVSRMDNSAGKDGERCVVLFVMIVFKLTSWWLMMADVDLVMSKTRTQQSRQDTNKIVTMYTTVTIYTTVTMYTTVAIHNIVEVMLYRSGTEYTRCFPTQKVCELKIVSEAIWPI